SCSHTSSGSCAASPCRSRAASPARSAWEWAASTPASSAGAGIDPADPSSSWPRAVAGCLDPDVHFGVARYVGAVAVAEGAQACGQLGGILAAEGGDVGYADCRELGGGAGAHAFVDCERGLACGGRQRLGREMRPSRDCGEAVAGDG